MSNATSMVPAQPPAAPPRRGGWFRLLTVVLLALTGLGMAPPGAYLAALGGSLYYLVAGVLILACAYLLLRRRRIGVQLFGLVFLGTAAWSLWEVGFDGWALMPRLVFLAVAGLWLLLPWVWRDTEPTTGRARTALLSGLAVVAVALVAGAVTAGSRTTSTGFVTAWTPTASRPSSPQVAGEWTQYGATAHGTRYTPLSEITPANVGALEQAWVYRTSLTAPKGARQGNLQVTPVMADGVLYGCTAWNSVFALDPVTGRQLWRYDPEISEEAGGHAVCRGVTFFRASPAAPDCPTRVLVGTVNNTLIALDARTGRLCPGFGAGGVVDLLVGMGDFPRRWFHPNSPPTIVNGVAVIGHYIADNQSTQMPPGVIRGYDAVTGQLRWAFDPGRPDQTAPLPPGQNYTPSTPNAWAPASGDDALGLVYVPMGNGSPDFIGAQRTPETERFSTAVVALDSATGAVRWTFQAVHHDLWDYDLAAQPVLIDFPTAAGSVPGLVLPTKTGQLFVLDRRNGQPLTPVEERRVPASDVPGERAAPTQPFSVGMPDFVGPDLTERDMWGITPFDQLACRISFKKARYQGIYTPPRLGTTIRYPGELGGIDWGSVSVDEGRGLLIVNSNHMADLDRLVTREEADELGLVFRGDRTPPRGAPRPKTPGAPMAGTPYAIAWGPYISKLEVPCQRPPYGYLTAVDLKTRKAVWRRTIGDARNSGPFGIGLGLPFELGAPNIGGSLSTAGGVVFMGATQDEIFRAIDVRSGKTLWQRKLPAAGHASPMSYRGPDGRQYVVIAAGGRSLRTKGGDHIVAYRLK